MPFPVGVQLVTVTAGASGYHAPDGTAYAGTIKFTPSVSRVTSATHGVIALGPVNATLSASGMFTANLLATDADGFSPSGWTYRVDEEFTNAPGRSYSIGLPAAVASVALPSVSPVEPSTGTETTAVASHVSATDPHGDRAYTTTQVATRAAAATQIIAGTGLSGGGTLAADRTLAVAFGATGTTVCVGNDSRLSDARTPTAHAASHGSGGSDPITIAQSQVAGLTVALGEKAALAGATFTGVVTASGTDLVVLGTGKGFRFRPTGSALDLEAAGADFLISNWSGATVGAGTQRSYFRLSVDAQNVQVAGKVEFCDALYGATRHVLDGAANTLGFHGAAPVAKQTVAGSRGGNAALADLITKLATLGLITDSTTA